MPNTITAFITMVAGTKARAGHVNTNFNNYRGTLLPINTDTASASHQTHDLGSSDHYWRRAYLTEPPYINGSQLGKIEIETLFDGSVPAYVVDDIGWLGRTAFPKAIETGVRFQFVVPPEYISGNRISLNTKGYCETGGSHIVLESWSALYKAGVTDGSLTSPSNVLTSTANVNPPTTAAIVFSDTSLRVTDSSGRINSVTVTAGDVIAVNLKRLGANVSDTNTGYFFLNSLVVDLNN